MISVRLVCLLRFFSHTLLTRTLQMISISYPWSMTGRQKASHLKSPSSPLGEHSNDSSWCCSRETRQAIIFFSEQTRTINIRLGKKNSSRTPSNEAMLHRMNVRNQTRAKMKRLLVILVRLLFVSSTMSRTVIEPSNTTTTDEQFHFSRSYISTHRLIFIKLLLLVLLGCFFTICACQLMVRQISADQRRTHCSSLPATPASVSTIPIQWTAHRRISSPLSLLLIELHARLSSDSFNVKCLVRFVAYALIGNEDGNRYVEHQGCLWWHSRVNRTTTSPSTTTTLNRICSAADDESRYSSPWTRQERRDDISYYTNTTITTTRWDDK